MPVDDQLLEEMRGMRRDIAAMSGRSPSGGNSVSGNTSGILDKMAGGVDSTISGMSKLAGNTATVNDVLGATSSFLGNFGNAGKLAGHSISELGEGVINVNRSLNETGKYGVTFGQNLGEANLAVKNAQLTIPEFTAQIQQNGKAMAGFAGGQNASAKAFLGVLAEIQQTPAAQNFKAMGMTQVEFADALAMTSQSMVGQDLSTKEAHDKAIASTLKYVGELNAIAELTGRSRKDQEAATKKVMESAEIEAAMLLKMKVDPEFGNRMKDATTAMGAFGPGVQQLLKEEATGGARSEAALKMKANLGPAADALKAYSDAVNSGNAEEIKRTKQAAEIALIQRGQDENLLKRTTLMGNKTLADGEFITNNFELQKNIAAEKVKLEKEGYQGDLNAMAQQRILEKMRLEQDGKKLEYDAKTGKVKEVVNEGAVVGRGINQVENMGKVAGGVVAEGFNKLNTQMGQTVTERFPEFNNKLKELSTLSGMKGQTGLLGKNVGEELLNRTGTTPAAPNESADAKVKERNAKRLNGSPGIPDFLNGGDFNKMFENFGKETTIDVHGEEAIVRKDQMGQIMSKMQNQMSGIGGMPNMNNIAQQIQSQIGPELNSMLNNIKTKVSSATTDSQGFQAPKPTTTPQPAPLSGGSASINDLKDQLIQLNKGIMQLISYSAETVNLNEKQVRAIKGSSNNRYA